MIFDRRWLRIPLLLAEDGGGDPGGGDDDAGAPETPPPEGNPPAEPEFSEPGYFSQLPGEKAKSEAYKALYKHQKLDELTDAYLAEHEELEKLKANASRSIVVPEKGDKEGAA